MDCPVKLRSFEGKMVSLIGAQLDFDSELSDWYLVVDQAIDFLASNSSR